MGGALTRRIPVSYAIGRCRLAFRTESLHIILCVASFQGTGNATIAEIQVQPFPFHFEAFKASNSEPHQPLNFSPQRGHSQNGRHSAESILTQTDVYSGFRRLNDLAPSQGIAMSITGRLRFTMSR